MCDNCEFSYIFKGARFRDSDLDFSDGQLRREGMEFMRYLMAVSGAYDRGEEVSPEREVGNFPLRMSRLSESRSRLDIDGNAIRADR